MATTTDGTVPFRGYRTWYRVSGELPAADGRPPVLVLHGGPGFPHDYLEDLAGLAGDGRAVVFYDQIGCGSSDHPDDDSLWTIATFVEELAAVRDALGLERVHLLGHSWGGWLALEYALGRPDGLVSLVLASTCASLPALAVETRRLKDSLPADARDAIDRHEADGTTDDPEYQQATMAYYTQWLCRLSPFPDHVMRSFANLNDEVYATMQGPEWNVTGNLKEWDVTARLGELDMPVLVTSGGHDEMTPPSSARSSTASTAPSGRSSRIRRTCRWPRSRSATARSSRRSSTASRPARPERRYGAAGAVAATTSSSSPSLAIVSAPARPPICAQRASASAPIASSSSSVCSGSWWNRSTWWASTRRANVSAALIAECPQPTWCGYSSSRYWQSWIEQVRALRELEAGDPLGVEVARSARRPRARGRGCSRASCRRR